MKLETNRIVNSITNNLKGLFELTDVIQSNLKDTDQTTREKIAEGIGKLLATKTQDIGIVDQEISKLNLKPYQSLYLELAVSNLIGYFKSILMPSNENTKNEPVIANLS